MILTPIHLTWGTQIKFTDTNNKNKDFFEQSKSYWTQLLAERRLLVFKQMHLHDRFYGLMGRYFGIPWDAELYRITKENTITGIVDKEKFVVGIASNGYESSLQTKELLWHADLPNLLADSFPGYKPYPIRSLYLIQHLPEHNPTTNWMDLTSAIDFLPPNMLELAQKMQVVQHDPYKGSTFKSVPDQIYPFIKIHPITGKKSLRLNIYDNVTPDFPFGYIKSVMLDGNVMPDNELLRQFTTYLEQIPELVYKHSWDLYDIVVYDNHSTLHSRASVTGPLRTRRMLRMNINWIY